MTTLQRTQPSTRPVRVLQFGQGNFLRGFVDWYVDVLNERTGLDADVSAYVSADPAYAEAMERIESLLLFLLPRYRAEGKSYVTIGFGCTGGRHRSVHVAERVAQRLRDAGFSPTVTHRDLKTSPQDSLEGGADGEADGVVS